MGWSFGVAEFPADCGEGGVVGVVAIDVTQQGAELCPCCGIEAAVLFEAVLGTGFELIEVLEA